MKRMLAVAAVSLVAVLNAVPAALAADMTYEEAIADVEATLGFVPTFMKEMPRAGFAGAWLQLKGL
jgi:hypothetical protein